MNNIDFSLDTHTGWVRELNEDSHLALPKFGLWVIADGMGGHEAGEVASGITIREISRSVEQGMPLPRLSNQPTVQYKPPPTAFS